MIADKHTHIHTMCRLYRHRDRQAHHNTPLHYRGGVIMTTSVRDVTDRQTDGQTDAQQQR